MNCEWLIKRRATWVGDKTTTQSQGEGPSTVGIAAGSLSDDGSKDQLQLPCQLGFPSAGQAKLEPGE